MYVCNTLNCWIYITCPLLYTHIFNQLNCVITITNIKWKQKYENCSFIMLNSWICWILIIIINIEMNDFGLWSIFNHLHIFYEFEWDELDKVEKTHIYKYFSTSNNHFLWSKFALNVVWFSHMDLWRINFKNIIMTVIVQVLIQIYDLYTYMYIVLHSNEHHHHHLNASILGFNCVYVIYMYMS